MKDFKEYIATSLAISEKRELLRGKEGAGSGPKYPTADKGEWYGDADYKARDGHMVSMSPEQYLKRVRPLDVDEGSRDNIDDLKNHIQSGRTLDPLAIYEDGKEDGRHRAYAAKELGIESVPVILFGKQFHTGTRAPKMREQCKMDAFEAVTWQAALLLEGRRKLVTSSQTKLDKAQATDTGYVNRGLTLSSAMEARPFIGGRFTACHGATAACAFACVGSQTGQGALPSSKIARIGRTLAMHVDLKRFNALLDCEIERERMRQANFGFKLAFRFNVASDHWRLATECAKRNKLVKFYDYSAIPNAAYEHARQVANGNASWDSQPYVQRVYSRKDGVKSDLIARAMLKDGFGISVVFDIKKGDALPEFWNGSPVIDGDVNDLWFLRAPKDSAFVVGLRVKGSNKQKQQAIDSGFAVKVGA